MSALRFILGDQLTRAIPSLNGLDPAVDVVLMAEVMDEATYVPHHKQKIAYLFSAMRHFAEDLRAEGVTVDYVKLDDGGKLRPAPPRPRAVRATPWPSPPAATPSPSATSRRASPGRRLPLRRPHRPSRRMFRSRRSTEQPIRD